MQDNPIINFFKWLGKPFDWPRELYSNFNHWYIIRKMCKEPSVQKMFKDRNPEIRFDNIYRLYTVINIPEDMYKKEASGARETFLVDELRKVEEFTLRLGVSEILYPEFNIITDVPDSYAYLLTLETDKDSLSFMESFYWIVKMFLWTCIILAINALILNTTGNTIIGWISSLFS